PGFRGRDLRKETARPRSSKSPCGILASQPHIALAHHVARRCAAALATAARKRPARPCPNPLHPGPPPLSAFVLRGTHTGERSLQSCDHRLRPGGHERGQPCGTARAEPCAARKIGPSLRHDLQIPEGQARDGHAIAADPAVRPGVRRR
ncbi:hypothetical protein OY671_009535, partial [Metschnikowia pulcherrima]